MKKIALISSFFLTVPFLQGMNFCMCFSTLSVNTLSVTTYYVEGGCCSGVAVQSGPVGGVDLFASADGGTTWLLTSSHLYSNEYGQDACCD